MDVKKDKKAQAEFAWIFAVIVGAIVLFLAFYFVGKTILTQKEEETTTQAQRFEVIMNPFSSLGGIAKATSGPLELPQKNIVLFDCYIEQSSGLGYQEITLQKDKNSPLGIPKKVYDKYIFSESILEGKRFQTLSMPFEMPWRIADIIIIWPYNREYCFLDTPKFIEETLSGNKVAGLNISNIHFEKTTHDCHKESIKVCFRAENCDINVKVEYQDSVPVGVVEKDGKTIYFLSEPLLYAAIFSDKESYNCNIKRLFSRMIPQIAIYKEKMKSLNSRNCKTLINFVQLESSIKTIIDSTPSLEKIKTIATYANSIKKQNENADCPLF